MAKSDVNFDKYANEIFSGKTQRQAYYVVYPHSLKWTPKAVDEKASTLFNSEKVQQRYKALLEANRGKSIITREELLKGLAKGFKMAMGEEEMNITLTDKGYVTENAKIKSVDLKALASIAEKIAKMEGFITDKVEHSGKIDANIKTTVAKIEEYEEIFKNE